MDKVYYLKACSTCKRIMKELGIDEKIEIQDIKTERITERQLGHMKSLSGSYESLFSRTAMKYKELGLKDKNLTEDEYKNYILDEYTFLKRPVMIIKGQIFIGNSKKVVEAARQALS